MKFLNKRFVIAVNSNDTYSILYQTDGCAVSPKTYKRIWRTVAVVHSGIQSYDAATLCLALFDRWLSWFKTGDADKERMRIYYTFTEFDPITETFQDLVDRYQFKNIDDDIENLVFTFLNDTFGENGGWDINKSYKLQQQSMIRMWLMGYCVSHNMYGNKFRFQEFYESAVNGINKIVDMYGNRIQ